MGVWQSAELLQCCKCRTPVTSWCKAVDEGSRKMQGWVGYRAVLVVA